MSSRRLQVLAFVRCYIGEWGESPSLREIAAGVGISRRRAHDHVRQLTAEGLLLNRRGPRGLALPTDRDAAIRTLEALGYTVFGGTETRLLDAPALTYAGSDQENRGNGDGGEK